jgi:hypothetical protein
MSATNLKQPDNNNIAATFNSYNHNGQRFEVGNIYYLNRKIVSAVPQRYMIRNFDGNVFLGTNINNAEEIKVQYKSVIPGMPLLLIRLMESNAAMHVAYGQFLCDDCIINIDLAILTPQPT